MPTLEATSETACWAGAGRAPAADNPPVAAVAARAAPAILAVSDANNEELSTVSSFGSFGRHGCLCQARGIACRPRGRVAFVVVEAGRPVWRKPAASPTVSAVPPQRGTGLRESS